MTFIKIIFVFLVIYLTLFDVCNCGPRMILDFINRKTQIMKQKLLKDISRVDIMHCSIEEDSMKGRSWQHVSIPSKLKNVANSIKFRLFTKLNKNKYILLNKTAQPADGLPHTKIIDLLNKYPLKIITHGWLCNAEYPSVANLTKAYLETSDKVNVIEVDWSEFADNINYLEVVQKIRDVGHALARFIDSLSTRYDVQGARIHLIGHSLGAHVVGNAGIATDITIQRVTGLDPAYPLFLFYFRSYRLNRGAARFVDVIHTCGGLMGFSQAMGHADFYANGGTHPQPGCSWILLYAPLSSLSTRCSFIPPGLSCSHNRAHVYFAESIRRPNAFKSYVCSSWNDFINNLCPNFTTVMGEHVDQSSLGTFYLQTHAKPPYGLV